jgi:ectoine hydroxylase-related dioxygenase (phytanoyl-CoA dioxygenase family)
MKTDSAIRSLTQEEIRFYKDNGYLVVEGLFSPEECDRILEIAKSHADDRFSAILNLDRTVPAFRDVMKDPKIVRILETLQGGEVVGLMSQVLFKEAGSPYASQAWNPHQDNAYPQARDGAYITINLFLRDADPENGGLYIYPGSQREGTLPFEPTVSYREKVGTNPGNSVKVPSQYKRVDLIVPKGGMFIMNSNLIHGSHPNGSAARSRPLFSISYLTRGEKFIPGNTAKREVIPLR